MSTGIGILTIASPPVSCRRTCPVLRDLRGALGMLAIRPLADENAFLVQFPTDEAIAIGAVMNAKNEASLRIDTTQHQMHAVMMAMDTLYSNKSNLNADPQMLNEDEPYDSPNW